MFPLHKYYRVKLLKLVPNQSVFELNNIFFRRLENEAGTVFYVSDVQVERILSDLDHDHQIASIGRKEKIKLGFILNKNSPYKPMFDQVQKLSC